MRSGNCDVDDGTPVETGWRGLSNYRGVTGVVASMMDGDAVGGVSLLAATVLYCGDSIMCSTMPVITDGLASYQDMAANVC